MFLLSPAYVVEVQMPFAENSPLLGTTSSPEGLGGGNHIEDAGAGEGPAVMGLKASRWGTVFLDVDEVLCIGQAEAGWDLSRTFARGQAPDRRQLATLFSPVARNALAVAHRRSGGAKYVISSSWREHFSREQMVLVLEGAGLQFVADNLHEGDTWRCVPIRVHRDRHADIVLWLETHHRGEPFVVLDDLHSAGRLLLVQQLPDSPLYGRVVVCTPGTGLTMDHVDDIVNALQRPTPWMQPQ